jgi:hypothetical protein
MSHKYSARIVPEIEASLRESGLLTALVTLDSPRFAGYMKKPANLLHDGWTYVEAEESEPAFYRLGDPRGIRQELRICRRTRTATLLTVQPKLGRTQRLVYSQPARDIVENSVRHDFGTHQAVHVFLFLSRREGRLARLDAEAAAA